jgi:hypothetical protein
MEEQIREEIKDILGLYADSEELDKMEPKELLVSFAARYAYFEMKMADTYNKNDKKKLFKFIRETKRNDAEVLGAFDEDDTNFVNSKIKSIRAFLEKDKDYLKTYFNLYIGVEALNVKAKILYDKAVAKYDTVFKPQDWLWNQEAMIGAWNIYLQETKKLGKNARKRIDNEPFNIYMRFMYDNYPHTLGNVMRSNYEGKQVIDIVDVFYKHMKINEKKSTNNGEIQNSS